VKTDFFISPRTILAKPEDSAMSRAAVNTAVNRAVDPKDLEFILSHLRGEFDQLRGERVLITGATGFFGKWLTQTLLKAQDEMQLGCKFAIVSRNKERALTDSPWLKGRADVEFIESDVRHLKPEHGVFQTIIHGAAAASRDLNENQPLVMFDTILEGTRNVLRLAEKSRRFMFISSGAVYGPQPAGMEKATESYLGAPDPLDARSAYGEAKRAAEFICASEAKQKGFELKIARCYAFIGPYLPLDIHFAAGNFLRDVLKNEPMRIGGDGTPLRSYLYAADLMIWLFKILISGQSGRAYNVGSDAAVSIHELAATIHKCGMTVRPERKSLTEPILIAKAPTPGRAPECYVPAIQRAREELGLGVFTPLDEAVLKTLRWHLANI
jgi:nucleoside-diphosphate-sugar epimerase